MIFPVPLFAVREWGSHVRAGDRCPDCGQGRLQAYVVCSACLSQVFTDGKSSTARCQCGQDNPAQEEWPSLQCSGAACRSFFQAKYVRNVFSSAPPSRMGSFETRNMPLFATVQHYLIPHPPEGALHDADFVMDIDRGSFEDALEALCSLVAPLEAALVPHQVYFSGSKGFHVIVPSQAMGARPSADLNTVQYRRMALKMAQLTATPVDPAIYSRARLFREPNTVHASTGLYKVPLAPGEYAQARDIARQPRTDAHFLGPVPPAPHPQMQAWFAQAQIEFAEESPSSETASGAAGRTVELANPLTFGNAPPCVTQALEEGPPMPGTRNALNKALSAYLVAQGEDEAVMKDWARHVPGASSMPVSERMQEAVGTFRWVKRSGYEFDCRDMRNIHMCDPKCPLLNLFGAVSASNGLFSA